MSSNLSVVVRLVDRFSVRLRPTRFRVLRDATVRTSIDRVREYGKHETPFMLLLDRLEHF